MIRKTLLLSIILTSHFAFAQNADYLAYIDKYKDIAIKEMRRAGVPASIKLSQAILESNAGRSTLARRANNHFGIKCHSSWKGRTYYREDDDYDDSGRLIKSCFRSYRNGEDSFIAHSEFLRDPKKEARYGFLFRLNPQDYKRWAYGLKKAGYATSANYHNKLIYIIETYELYKYDQPRPPEVVVGTGPGAVTGMLGVLLNNDVKMVLARPGETPASIAQKTDTRLKCILKWNEKLEDPNENLEENERIYIQRKRGSYRERQKYHYVKQGETMYEISQLYGVRLKRLYRRNRLPEGTQPATGEKIKLRGWKVKTNEVPKLVTEVPPPPPKPQINLPDEVDDGQLDMQDEEADENTIEPLPGPDNPVETDPDDFTPDFPSPATPSATDANSPPASEDGEETTTEPPAPVVTNFHLVKQGDTLYNISRRYGMTVAELKALNGLTDNIIHKGQRLKVK